MRALGVFVAATALVACDNPVAPAFATAVAEVLDVSSASYGTTVKTEVTVANATQRVLYVNFCATGLERRVGETTWQPVGGILCTAIGYVNPFHAMLPIEPGEFRRLTLHLFTSQPLRNLDGTNRFRVTVPTVAEFPVYWWRVGLAVELSTSVAVSNEFPLHLR